MPSPLQNAAQGVNRILASAQLNGYQWVSSSSASGDPRSPRPASPGTAPPRAPTPARSMDGSNIGYHQHGGLHGAGAEQVKDFWRE
jgi:hypothetical protein